MKKCTNPETGILISRFQLGSLNSKEQLLFEEHLLECDFCAEELDEMYELGSALRENREELLANLRAEGLSFNVLKEEILSEQKTSCQEKSLDRVWNWLKRTFTLPEVYVPVSVMASIALFLVIFTSYQPGSPYVDFLHFDSNYDNILILRDSPTTEGERLYKMGISEYLKGNWRSAAALFEESVKLCSDEFDAWFYLGVSHYLDKNGKPAIASLQQASKLNPDSELTVLYLSEAYLLSNLPEKAVPLLESLQSKENEFSKRASEYLSLIEKIQAK